MSAQSPFLPSATAALGRKQPIIATAALRTASDDGLGVAPRFPPGQPGSSLETTMLCSNF